MEKFETNLLTFNCFRLIFMELINLYSNNISNVFPTAAAGGKITVLIYRTSGLARGSTADIIPSKVKWGQHNFTIFTIIYAASIYYVE